MNESLRSQQLRLSDEQRQNLHGVIEDFFRCFQLQDSRAMLWKWLVAALGSESSTYNSGLARSNLVFVYENLERLIEALHEINKRRKKKRRWNHKRHHS